MVHFRDIKLSKAFFRGFVAFYIPKWAQITNLTKIEQINNNFDYSLLRH